MENAEIEAKAINTIRFLAADAVQNANSGHPGLPMGTAAMAYVLWRHHLRFNPKDPSWPNRDRFILSAGHGSMLLYGLLHLFGYDLPLDEIKNFRQWGSITPGHPEYGETPGVETTTGPLGQGFATGVGMAIGFERQAAMYNRDGFPILDHFIYGIVSDGDLMEGVASEAASLAGHLRLGRLIYLYDDNKISIDGSTDLTFTEDRGARFRAYDWHVLHVEDGNDTQAVDEALKMAKQDPRPSLIICRTHIGYGLPTKQDTASAHGEPPGEDELAGAKDRLGWPSEPRFFIPDDVRKHFRTAGQQWLDAYESWVDQLHRYRKAYPDLAEQFERTQANRLPEDLGTFVPNFTPDPKGMATRASSGKVLNGLANTLPELIGGSADLTGSNKTNIEGEAPMSPEARGNRYLHFGVREHAMGSALSGLALYGGLIPYGGTFLVFSDYMRPAVRLAAMMKLQVIYVFTHDSIGLGEDGPTHQPVEQLAALRAIPHMTVIRPADANEVGVSWLVALERTTGPTALALTRQPVPTLDRELFSSAEGLRRGAYVLMDLGEADPHLILMASGSEVPLIVEAGQQLAAKGISVRAVSFPSWELFAEQSQAYQDEILPPTIPLRLSVEAGVTQGWEKWVGDRGVTIGLNRFGGSAPYQKLFNELGFSVDRIIEKSLKLLDERN